MGRLWGTRLALVALTAVGCASGADLDPSAAALGQDGKADIIGPYGETLTVPTLAKRYALVFDSRITTRDRDEQNIPKTILTSIVADVAVAQDVDRVELMIQPCAVSLPEISGRQPEVDPAVIQRIDEVTVEGRLRPFAVTPTPSPEETDSSSEETDSSSEEPDSSSEERPPADDRVPGERGDDTEDASPADPPASDSDEANTAPTRGVFNLVTDDAAFVGGAKLDSPLTDPLPTDKRDPRLIDLDDDNKPGLSVHIDGFRAYASFRLRFQMKGVVSANGIEGTPSFELDTEIVGDDIPFVDAAKRARRAAERTIIVDQEHHFTMTPLPGDTETCGFSL